MRACDIAGCDEPARSRGLCNAHYHSRRRAGDLPPRAARPVRLCVAPGCGRRHSAGGWCKTHHNRLRTLGDAFPNVPVVAPTFGRPLAQAPASFDLEDLDEL